MDPPPVANKRRGRLIDSGKKPDEAENSDDTGEKSKEGFGGGSARAEPDDIVGMKRQAKAPKEEGDAASKSDHREAAARKKKKRKEADEEIGLKRGNVHEEKDASKEDNPPFLVDSASSEDGKPSNQRRNEGRNDSEEETVHTTHQPSWMQRSVEAGWSMLGDGLRFATNPQQREQQKQQH